MIQNKRYPLHIITVSFGHPLGNTSIDTATAHIVVDVAQLSS